MSFELGILFAFAAMLLLGFGDFLIQKSTRKIGNWQTLFVISIIGSIALFPFVYKNLPEVFSSSKILLILAGSGAIILIAALLQFESLKRGKISVVEPIWSIEIPASAFAAFIILKEKISTSQTITIIALILGLVLVSFNAKKFNKKLLLEKGVYFAFAGAIAMGFANFFVGWGARATDALMINWFVNTFLTLACAIYIIKNKSLKQFSKEIKQNKKLLLTMSILDNGAWIAFAFAMTLAPIAIAVALSESYIIIAVLLGLFITKEKLRKHQVLGLIIAIISAIVLAYISGA